MAHWLHFYTCSYTHTQGRVIFLLRNNLSPRVSASQWQPSFIIFNEIFSPAPGHFIALLPLSILLVPWAGISLHFFNIHNYFSIRGDVTLHDLNRPSVFSPALLLPGRGKHWWIQDSGFFICHINTYTSITRGEMSPWVDPENCTVHLSKNLTLRTRSVTVSVYGFRL